jgi:hypothetical protein
MRRRFTYANVAATMALVFSMSGGALAAKHYLVNSTSQINPKVLKKLRGNKGAAGAPGSLGKEGLAGHEGKEGKEGKTGPEGPLLTALPSGKTLTGAFGAGDSIAKNGAVVEASFSYAFPVTSEPTVQIVQIGGPSTAQCPGTTDAPSAAAGFLCLYPQSGNSIETKGFEDFGTDGIANFHRGGVIFTNSTCTAPCHAEFWGTWAVTAK